MSKITDIKKVNLSDAELLEIFPESKQIIPDLIKELELKREDLLTAIIEQNEAINAECSDETYRYFWKSVHISPLREKRKLIEQKLARLHRQLHVIKGESIPAGAITNDMIQSAKEVPIETIFNQQFRQSGNKLFGLCPYHKEKTGSFCLYKNTNRCYCFGCGAKYNVIDAYIQLNKCNFNEAVLALTGGKR